MQGGLAPLSISIVLAEAHTKQTAAVFRFEPRVGPVGVGEGPIARASRCTAGRSNKVKGGAHSCRAWPGRRAAAVLFWLCCVPRFRRRGIR